MTLAANPGVNRFHPQTSKGLTGLLPGVLSFALKRNPTVLESQERKLDYELEDLEIWHR